MDLKEVEAAFALFATYSSSDHPLCQMTPSLRKEQFSLAWFSAIAAAANVNIHDPRVDIGSVDLDFGVADIPDVPYSGMVCAQLKCVTSLPRRRDGMFTMRLKQKNYAELRGKRYIPKVLIVVHIPRMVSSWLCQSPGSMLLKNCGYWVSLKDLPSLPEQKKVTVEIPPHQVLCPNSIRDLIPLLANTGAGP